MAKVRSLQVGARGPITSWELGSPPAEGKASLSIGPGEVGGPSLCHLETALLSTISTFVCCVLNMSSGFVSALQLLLWDINKTLVLLLISP